MSRSAPRAALFVLLAGCLAAGAGAAPAEPAAPADPLAAAVAELENVVGTWSVVTEFLAPDGTVARRAEGEYVFDWVIPDRVLAGRSDIPELGQTSALLFYVRETDLEIEMVSVGADGKLWVMTGPAGGDTRLSQEYTGPEGKPARLRFTRSKVTPDGFESHMEYTTDGGATWTRGNHQVFTRKR